MDAALSRISIPSTGKDHMNNVMARVILGLSGTGMLGFQIFASFLNGMGQAPQGHVEGYLFGVAFVSIVIAAPFILPTAESVGKPGLGKLVWAFFISVILVNSAVFSFSTRSEMTGDRGNHIGTYQLATSQKEGAMSDLSIQQKSKSYLRTSACSKPLLDVDVTFCNEVRKNKDKIAAADAVLIAGRPKLADPASAVLSWVFFSSEEWMAKAYPLLMAVVPELGSSICFYLALAPLAGGAAGRVPVAPATAHFQVVSVKLDEEPAQLEGPDYTGLVVSDGADYQPRKFGKPLPVNRDIAPIRRTNGRHMRRVEFRPANQNTPAGEE